MRRCREATDALLSSGILRMKTAEDTDWTPALVSTLQHVVTLTRTETVNHWGKGGGVEVGAENQGSPKISINQ